ncbi:hypothetical protein [Vibrio breoganii]|uniref:hypothetical protein n=1 Tax=Vibrio breoganii TaxID=553239 RepID=UPI0021C3EB53|nr:hypothetical protein [Vibrio breoganii]MDN3715474.1 hypothetical protein [Vibrio breoganii]
MKIHNLKLLMPLALTMLLTGCPIDGDNGSDGTVGLSGINCWDLNGNRINDDDEDKNNDGLWDADDCGSQNTISQNTDAVLNHQHFCEAFAALGQYPSSCPSMSHTPPTGTLTQQTRTTWYDDGLGNGWSCNQPPPNSGPVSIQPKADGYYWVVEGGFIAAEATFAVEDEINDARCFNL